MKILELRSENFKRIRVVQIAPDGHVVQITGANGEGKTSCLDSIWAAFGGKDAVPERPIRRGQQSARIEVKIGDGETVRYIVERTFTAKETYLKVTGPEGAKFSKPQQILDGLMGAIGFDPLAFMRMDQRQQFSTLRGLVKLDVDLEELEQARAGIYEERSGLSRELRNAQGAADAITVPDDLPDEPPDISAITARLAAVDSHNAPRRAAQSALDIAEARAGYLANNVVQAEEACEGARRHLDKCRAAQAEHADLCDRIVSELKNMPAPLDPNEIRAELDSANLLMEGFRQQSNKIDALARADGLKRAIDGKTAAIQSIDAMKAESLAAAEMPIEGLALADGVVNYNSVPLMQASAAEQLRVSAAIGTALNPKLRVLLCRDGSLLDSKSLLALGDLAREKDMQIWIERVDETGEVGIVIEDGHVRGQEALVEAQEKQQPTQQPDDPARQERAAGFIDKMIAVLPSRKTAAELDRDNAEVRTRCEGFPDLIATRWTGAYLARVKALKGT